MWFFKKKDDNTVQGTDIFSGFTDWHCHILPGVDDGVQTMEEALDILDQYEEWGVRQVWLTPHIMEDIPNETQSLRERFAELQQAYVAHRLERLQAGEIAGQAGNEAYDDAGNDGREGAGNDGRVTHDQIGGHAGNDGREGAGNDGRVTPDQIGGHTGNKGWGHTGNDGPADFDEHGRPVLPKPVQLHLAAENMMDNLFEERLEKNDLLPIGPKGDHLLVETSYFNPPMHLYDILLAVREAGYQPILAHPERYVYMEMRDYERLHGLGIKFQLNLFSQTGRYGRHVIKKMEQLQQRHYYSYVGTDLHRIAMLGDVEQLRLRSL